MGVIPLHDPRLVLLSVLVATVAAYAALDLSRRSLSRKGSRRLWIIASGAVMGLGIWTMHFVAMLAMDLGIRVAYDVPLTILSALIAVVASGFGFYATSADHPGTRAVVAGSLGFGLAVAGMHYVGMAAMRMRARVDYNAWLVLLSVAIAVGAAFVALQVAGRLRVSPLGQRRHVRVGSALLLGLAVYGMHYTGIAAARFHHISSLRPVGTLLWSGELQRTVVLIAIALVLAVPIAALADRRLRSEVANALELNRRESRLQALFEQLGVGLSHMDLEGKCLRVNQRYCDMLGYTRDEVLSMRLEQVTHQEDLPGDLDGMRRLVEGKTEAFTIEKRYVRKDGSVIWGSLTRSLVRDAAGRPEYFVSVVEDITARRQMASEHAALLQQSREAEERYRHLFEAIPMPVMVLERTTLKLLTVNSMAERHYGYSRFELLGMTLPDLVPEADVAAAREAIVGAQSGERLRGWRHVTRTGSLTDVELVVHRFTYSGREATLLVVDDVTRQRASERAVREASGLVNAVVDASPIAIVAITLDGTVRRWNPAAERLMGWSAAEMLGRSYLDCVPPERLDEMRAMDERLLRGDPVGTVETQCLHRDGTFLDVAVDKALLRDADRAPAGFVILFADVRVRKQLEAQFRQAQKMEAVGQLAGGIAHDFNNLLTVIKSYTEILQAEGSAGDWEHDLDEIHRAASRAAELTSHLLAFSRQQILRPRLVSLNTIVRDAQRMLARILPEDIVTITRLDEEIGGVEIDPSQMEQVIVNLALNARDAMPRGGTLMIATAGRRIPESPALDGVPPGRYVELTVSDSGVGMAPEVISRIFEPFFTTKEPGKGTGLGLSMVYGLVTQSGGYVFVTSTPGEGTLLRILLPERDGEGSVGISSDGTTKARFTENRAPSLREERVTTELRADPGGYDDEPRRP